MKNIFKNAILCAATIVSAQAMEDQSHKFATDCVYNYYYPEQVQRDAILLRLSL